MPVSFEPIGIIRTPYKKKEGMPIQPAGAMGVKGTIELKPEFAPGLKDLDGFSHIYLLYHLHESEGYNLEVKPFLDDKLRGLFATRAPRRPNPIGLSVVRLTGIKENILEIENVDMLDGTPLLDIKPYVSRFDFFESDRQGWLEGVSRKAVKAKSDKRFE